MRNRSAHNALQRDYYEKRDSARLRPRSGPYIERQVAALVEAGGLEAGQRTLEIGAGKGRYTIPLAARGLDVVAADLSAVLLDRLRGAAEGAARLVACDAAEPPFEDRAFERVVGGFVLHHVHDPTATLAALAPLLRPGGRLVLLEPNPLNPLYYVQIALARDMTWAGDGGILRMRAGPLRAAAEAAGLTGFRVRRFGFFPPFVTDGPGGDRIEAAAERVPGIDRVRPFQIFVAEAPR